MRYEFAGLLDDKRQSNPIEPLISLKIVVITGVLECLQVQLLDNHYFRVIESEKIINDGIVFSLENLDCSNCCFDCHVEYSCIAGPHMMVYVAQIFLLVYLEDARSQNEPIPVPDLPGDGVEVVIELQYPHLGREPHRAEERIRLDQDLIQELLASNGIKVKESL